MIGSPGLRQKRAARPEWKALQDDGNFTSSRGWGDNRSLQASASRVWGKAFLPLTRRDPDGCENRG
jgi:hypothetical protein